MPGDHNLFTTLDPVEHFRQDRARFAHAQLSHVQHCTVQYKAVSLTTEQEPAPGSRAVRRQPGLAELDDTTLAVRALITASQDLTVRMARRMGVNVSDMTAILWLSEHGPVGSAELARRLGISTAATTVLVDRLERAWHVERVRDTVDRRG